MGLLPHSAEDQLIGLARARQEKGVPTPAPHWT